MPTISSSSSMFCEYPNCSGIACTHFSSWILNNVKYSNTDNGKLYALFNNFGVIQQIEIYKDKNYFEIMAIGQGTSGSIAIIERNSSGITGSVVWDGTPVSFSTGATLNCSETMSSSSTSSLDSSSTSSQSLSSASSMSTGCCEHPLCHGAHCEYFGTWNIYGISQSNSNNCRLYVGMEYTNGFQQLRIYNDEELSDLVAIGQKSFAGTIQLVSVNNSGIYGNIWWDGHPMGYPETLILDCKQSSSSSRSSESIGNTSSSTSSSSSSSTSSSSSSESSESIGNISSSSSSMSTSSSSSSTSQSTSSSSSIDSSSTSSESIGNTSSSSSSSLEIWNQSKPLILANSAISSITVQNRLSQTIKLFDSSYEIGKVYCYLYSSNVIHNYNVNLSLCLCNDNGSPSTIIETRSINAIDINSDMWYSFDFSVTGTSPANKLVSFVLWQDGGNEDDYIMWGYNSDIKQTYAWLSKDNTVWSQQSGITRALKVIGIFDSIDLDNYQVNTSGAITRTLSQSMNVNSSYYNTVYKPNPSRIELENPNLIMSFVVDGSGSMGWNDRNNNRKEFITNTIQKFNDYYPSNVLFDIVKFGSRIANPQNITSGMGQVVAITFDIRTPSRTTYVFTINGAVGSIRKNATYTHNGFTYIPFKDYDGKSEVAMVGDGIPLDEGTLQKTSGDGANSLVFRSVRTISIDTAFFVASGLKNMEDGHTYNFAGSYIDDNSLFTISNVSSDVTKWQAISPSDEFPQILGSIVNGPRDTSSIDIIATENLVARVPIGIPLFFTNPINSSVLEGDLLVTVSNASLFVVGEQIDLIDTEYASIGHTITAIDLNEITFTPPSQFNISNSADGGFIQQSSVLSKKSLIGTTGKVYLRDVTVGRQIVFYLQTSEGYIIEWDIKATSEWLIYNIYWLGETAILPISVFDIDGNPFPNGTRVDLEVGSMASADSYLQASQQLTETTEAGESTIYVNSIDGFAKDQFVTLVDNSSHMQIMTIFEVGTDEIKGPYITFTSSLSFAFSPSNGASVVTSSNPKADVDNSPVSVNLSLVDVTPICTDTDSNPDDRKEYDPPSVPKETSYQTLNNASSYIRYGTVNVPTINGVAVIRILPITEDVLKSNFEKSNDVTRQLNIGPEEEFVGQGSQNEGDLTDIGDITQTTTTVSAERDYTIESPIYLYNGTAESAMTTTSTDLISINFPELTIPGIPYDAVHSLEGVEYSIFPAAVEVTPTNVVTAKQYFDKFVVNFIAPYTIYSVKDNKSVGYNLPEYEPPPPEGCKDFLGYRGYSLPGVFATNATENPDRSFTINYIVTNKLVLVSSAQMRIRVYSNSTISQESLALPGIVETSHDLNVKYNPINVLQADGTYKAVTKLSQIDTWRAVVSGDTEALKNAGLSPKTTLEGVSNDPLEVRRNNLNDVLGVLGIETNYEDDAVGNDGPINIFYTSGFEQAKQYDVYDTTIDVVNGRASFTLPPNDLPSMIIVEASIAFSNNYEAVRNDAFAVRNPIVVSSFVPNIITIVDGAKYELSLPVSWEDGTEIIDVGTVVNVRDFNTAINPSESLTDENGQANGLFIGTKDVFYYNSSEDCPKHQQIENVTVIVTHPQSGYTTTLSRIICWEGTPIESEYNGMYFHIVGDDAIGYADGSANTVSTFSSDLFGDALNTLWVTNDGIQKLMGKDQPGQARREIWWTGSSGESFVIPSRTQWGLDGKMSFVTKSFNKNIGLPPLEIPVNFQTSHYDGNQLIKFDGIKGLDEFDEPVAPKISIKEPLGIDIELERHIDIGFIRNGVDSPNIVATITWGEEKITNKFIDPKTNTEIPYPMPLVTFKAGKCFEKNGDGLITDSRCVLGDSPETNSCLILSDHDDIGITSSVVQAALIRTDKNDNGSGVIHTHACIVDENGNGETTSTITLDGIVSQHHHNIVNYETVDQTQDILDPPVDSHDHGVRSVAITQIKPTENTGIEMSINGYVVYDPTNCIPNENGSNPSYFPVGLPSGNRIMFDTLYVLGYTPTNSNLQLVVETGIDLNANSENFYTIELETNEQKSIVPAYFAAKDPYETIKGFDVRIAPKFPSYIYESSPGVANVVNEMSVDDGTRVSIEIIPYKAKADKPQNVPHIVGPGIINKYMILKFIVSANANGQFATRSFYITVNSNLQWLPGVTNLMEEVSNDSSYITNALNKMDGFMGCSQLHDAVIESAQKIIQEQTDKPEYKQYEKVIFIVSDGDENKSINSISQAINNISFIDGKGNTPTVNIILGNADPSDSITLKKYAAGSNGNFYPINNMNTSMINDIIDFIVAKNSSFNYGTFRSLVSFDQAVIPISFNLGETYVPSGTTMNYRTRYSADAIQWSPWTSWRASESSEISYSGFTTRILQYQYEVQFYGDKYFNSPILYGVPSESENGSSSSESEGGTSSSSSSESIDVDDSIQGTPTIEYLSPKSLVLFFKPVSINTNKDEYLSSILITHEADIPSTSKIEYGVVQSNDTDIDYYEIDNLSVPSDKHEIMLTRYNEQLVTENLKSFTALNGKWPERCSIEIYRFNSQNPDGILVASSEYVINNKKGEITFFNSQPKLESFTINVLFRPFFRLIAKVTNYGLDAAVIHHIGVIYNITKRIPRSSNGNIIHKPINQRL